MPEISLGRIWDESDDATVRVLVDRLWPRGVAKAAAPWQRWYPEVAPSTALRRWLHANRSDYPVFCQRYRDELTGPDQRRVLAVLREIVERRPLLLLTAAAQWRESHLPVIGEAIRGITASGAGPGSPSAVGGADREPRRAR